MQILDEGGRNVGFKPDHTIGHHGRHRRVTLGGCQKPLDLTLAGVGDFIDARAVPAGEVEVTAGGRVTGCRESHDSGGRRYAV
jgi:hypothetical protein